MPAQRRSPEERLAALERDDVARQHAMTDVLRVMADPSFDLEAVLRTIIQSAVELGRAEWGIIYLREGDLYRAAAGVGPPTGATLPYEREHPDQAGRHSVVGRVIVAREVVQIEDVLDDPEYDQPVAMRDGFRTLMGVPIIRDAELVGVIGLARAVVERFSEGEVALVGTFAEQAAIAIETARLLETIERQRTEFAAVLGAIGSPGSDLVSVLRAILESAVRLCHAELGTVYLQDGDAFRVVAAAGPGAESIEAFEREHPDRPGRHSMTGRVLLSGETQHIIDVLADPEYDQPDAQAFGGFRTLLGVPIKRKGRTVGVFNLGRTEVRPYDDAEIALVATYGGQIGVAIEIARLLETIDRQRTELVRYISPQIAELVSSDEGEQLLAGHRRQITALFADLRGFTHFSETAEPEELLGVLRAYHAAMGELVVEHGGTLEHFAGDGMLVWFNDPVVQDDHARRAVTMAIAMRTRFDELARGWHKLGYELGLGIGISTGYATLGRIGFEGRYDYAALGNVVILASRLSTEAKAGQILLAQRTYAAVEDVIEVEPAGDLELKGISRPVPAFLALGIPTTATD